MRLFLSAEVAPNIEHMIIIVIEIERHIINDLRSLSFDRILGEIFSFSKFLSVFPMNLLMVLLYYLHC